MVRLRKTASLNEKLQRLGSSGSAKEGLANELPLKLLEAVQEHLSNDQQEWIEHQLLVKISKWNKSLDCMPA